MIRVHSSTWVLNLARISATMAKITSDAVAKYRGSTRFEALPTIGVMKIASRPTGARITPAAVAV